MCWPHDVGMASAFSCLVGLVDYNGTTPPIVPFTFRFPNFTTLVQISSFVTCYLHVLRPLPLATNHKNTATISLRVIV